MTRRKLDTTEHDHTSDAGIVSVESSAGGLMTGATVAQATETAAGFVQATRFRRMQAKRSENTLRAHRGDLDAFAGFLADRLGLADAPTGEAMYSDPDAWQDVGDALILAFQQDMLNAGYAIGTVNRRVSTVKLYARLAGRMPERADLHLSYKEGVKIDQRRARTRRGAKKRAKTVRLTPEQVKALKTHPDTVQGRRDALIMRLLLDQGLRVGEIVSLMVGNFDLAAGTMQFYRQKVSKTQTHTPSQVIPCGRYKPGCITMRRKTEKPRSCGAPTAVGGSARPA